MANRIFGYTIILLGKVHYWGPNEKSYVKIWYICSTQV
jgi:hypothetical protein